MTFGEMVVYFRGRGNIRARMLAEGIGMKASRLSAIEKGTVGPPDFDTCKAISQFFNLNSHDRNRLYSLAAYERAIQTDKAFYEAIGVSSLKAMSERDGEIRVPVFRLEEGVLSCPSLGEPVYTLSLHEDLVLNRVSKRLFGVKRDGGVDVFDGGATDVIENTEVLARVMDKVDIWDCRDLDFKGKDLMEFCSREGRYVLDPISDKALYAVFGRLICSIV